MADFPTSGLLVSPITAEPSMPEHAHDPGRLVEAYVQMWLRETMVGRRFLRGRSLDDATEAVFELLNAGFLKLAGSTAGITGISVSTPPRPPRRRLRRPRSTLNGANGTVK